MNARLLVLLLCLLGGSSLGDDPSSLTRSLTPSLTTPTEDTERVSDGVAVAVAVAVPSFSPTEEEHIASVTVRMYCSTPGALIYYSLDGSLPTLSSLAVAPGESVLIDTIGVTVVRAFSHWTNESSSSVSDSSSVSSGSVSSSVSSSSDSGSGSVSSSSGSVSSDSSVRSGSSVSSVSSVSSAVVSKKYTVLSRCAQPVIVPGGGTFAGVVTVSIVSDTPGSRIIYTLDNTIPHDGQSQSSSLVSGPGTHSGTHSLTDSGTHSGTHSVVLTSSATITAVALKEHFAPSAVTKQTFVILPKAATPVIKPDQTVFAVSATLSILCATPNATVYYTTDGSTPSQSSYRLDSGSQQLVLDQAGSYVVTAFATVENMLQSDIVVKQLTIMPRAASPVVDPPPGTFVSKVSLCFTCPSASHVTTSPKENSSSNDTSTSLSGTVYYTLDGRSTPSQLSSHVTCGGCISLTDISVVHLRAFVVEENKSPSSIIAAEYSIVRPPYDEHPVNPNATLQMRPDVNVYVVEKNIEKGYCGKRNIRGRLVVLHNPIGHFDVVEPENGCDAGLALPSRTGRKSWIPSGVSLGVTSADESSKVVLPKYASHYSPQKLEALTKEDISVWEEEYSERSDDMGCEVVTNAGFFNVSSGTCLGDLVSAGNVVQTSEKHNVNFGIRSGKFVTGYVTSDEITASASRGTHEPFDTLVSGLGWLIREGEVYVDESFQSRSPPEHPTSNDANSYIYSSTYGEDMSAQTSGNQFSTLLSARTALGHDVHGRLLLLQVEGESWVRGMSLREFASFAKELGFYSAINLDGGGSATMRVNHTLVSEPSWQCTPEDYETGGASHIVPLDKTYCEKRVSSVTCIHSMPPPSFQPHQPNGHSQDQKQNSDDTKNDDHKGDSISPSPLAANSDAPSSVPASGAPTSTPSFEGFLRPSSTSHVVKSLEVQLRESKASESLFKSISLGLGFMLFISILVHVALCMRVTDLEPPPKSPAFQWNGVGNDLENNYPGHNLRSHNNSDVELTRPGHSHLQSPPSRVQHRGRNEFVEHHGVSSQNDPEHSGQSPGASHSTRHGIKDQRSPSSAVVKLEDEEDECLENFGLPDELDFKEFDDSEEDEETSAYKSPSDMAYINRPVAPTKKEEPVSTILEDEDDDDMDIEAEEQKSLLSPQAHPSTTRATETSRKKKKDKKSKSEKKSKKMSMNFSDRSL